MRGLRPAAAVSIALALTAAEPRLSAPATADADPASDVLAIQDTFLPYARPQTRNAHALEQAVDRVYERGNRIKVAVIASPADLGALGGIFWNQPGHYAKFLGKEISFLFVGPLLVVMPVGFGIYDGDRSTAAEKRVLAGVRVAGRSSDALTVTAVSAVEKLLAAGALRSKDVLRPRAVPYPAFGTRGQPMKLYYKVEDDSDRARVVLAIRVRTRTLVTFRLPLRRLHRRQGSFSLEWRVPKKLARGPTQVCASARDAAGNASPSACAALTIR